MSVTLKPLQGQLLASEGYSDFHNEFSRLSQAT